MASLANKIEYAPSTAPGIRAVLYTSEINGRQVCRDDLWLATTAALDALAGRAPVAEQIAHLDAVDVELDATVAEDAATIKSSSPEIPVTCFDGSPMIAAAAPVVPASGAAQAIVWPKTCDGKEQEAWEAYGQVSKLDMSRHPMFYIFLAPETDAARYAWKAGLEYAAKAIRDQIDLAPPHAAPGAQLSEPPEGWVLVPIEPTEEMIDAACDIDAKEIVRAANMKRYADAGLPGGNYATSGQIFAEEYKAALAAAPTTKKDAS